MDDFEHHGGAADELPAPQHGEKMDPQSLELMTVADFVAKFRVSRTALYRLLAQGDVTALKVGRRTLIARAEAERWLATLPTTNPNAA